MLSTQEMQQREEYSYHYDGSGLSINTPSGVAYIHNTDKGFAYSLFNELDILRGKELEEKLKFYEYLLLIN